jgi:phosphomannomutase
MKMVHAGSRPVSSDSGLTDIRDLVAANQFGEPAVPGKRKTLDHRADYIERLLSYVDTSSLSPLKVVANPGNGGAGSVMNELSARLPIALFPIQFDPDGNFPNGVPNPLVPQNRAPTIDAIKVNGADLGIAWDGDFDRCFLFDENGRFIEGYYIVGLLAQAFLERSPGEGIVHDPRLTWNTTDVVSAGGGRAIMSKAGHAFIKEKMREEDAIYGGEMSAHHYFRDFAYCDSGMIPWLLVIDLMSRKQKKLSELVDERMLMYPVSGEINRKIEDTDALMKLVEKTYGAAALVVDKTDGLSFEFSTWRFNIRSSNTEPVVRLNVESRGSEELMQEKTSELLDLMGGELA